MSYDYKETEEEIIVDKGIATREMWKDYAHGREHVSYDALVDACALRDRVPLVLDTDHDHTQPLQSGKATVGYADLAPCPDKRGLRTTWHFRKARLPAWLLERLRAREPIPVSIFQFTDVDAREQTHLLFDHIAILATEDPRCPIERCGVGVYDSKMPDEKTETKPETPEDPVQPPVQNEEPEKKQASAAPVEAAPEPPAPDPRDQEITDLKARLEKAEARVAAVRKPLVDVLTQQGYQAQELNPLSIETLQKMVQTARSAATEGLPGTVPAPPPEAPKSRDELVAGYHKRFMEKSQERWKDD